MGPLGFKILRKGKCWLLLLLSFSVLAWITNFAGDVVREAPGMLLAWSKIDASQVLHERERKSFTEQEQESFGEGVLDKAVQSYASHSSFLPHCPLPSPLLLGHVNLSFPRSLTLGDVMRKNEEVAAGQFKPPHCTAWQSVAILIPHRNREKHLLYLLHHLHPFLQRQQLHYGVYVIHQAGHSKFNRAKLLNVGYLEALKDRRWDCFIFHDVDLLPENDYNTYMCEQHPKHLVVGRNVTGYRLRYKGYFGGVTAMTVEQFRKVNGFSNNYWGWGGEDDDLRLRVEVQHMKVLRPPADVARYTMVFHSRDQGNEVNGRRMRLLERTHRVWQTDGLNSCSYKVLSVERPALYVNITTNIGRPPSRL